ncbi:MAG: potassium/proton antiporter [Nocardioidaceae bacterium]|nr:potassium/proton antiporter [Nocardioidaceae bacterium]
MDADRLDQLLLAGSAVLLLAILAVRASARVGLPSLLIYLAMGIVLGESVLGVEFDDAKTAHALGFAALVVILTEGGLTTKWAEVRPSLKLGVALATIGVGISVGVVAVVAHFVLGLSWELAVLLGAITSPTDAAAVFSVLRKVPLRPKLLGALEAESGLNDAPTVLLVVLLSTSHGLDDGIGGFVGLVVYELVAGVGLGAVVGISGAWLLRRVALPASGLYPIAVMAIAAFSYAGTAAVHASGFAAVYITALWLGNSELPHRSVTRSFAEGLAWLAQIGLFIMLGLLASPNSFDVESIVGGIVVGAALTFLARPLSVLVCSVPLRIPWREQGFLAVAGLRGAVPIVLASIPLAERVDRAEGLFNLVFVLVVVLTVLTAPMLPKLATALGVTVERAREVEVEAAPLERIAADLLQVKITDESRLQGVEIGELRLPPGTSVSLIVRDNSSFTPERRTSLKRGDDLLIVTPRADRDAIEKRLQTVSKGGRLATWVDDSSDSSR